jgi:hypothetical protein
MQFHNRDRVFYTENGPSDMGTVVGFVHRGEEELITVRFDEDAPEVDDYWPEQLTNWRAVAW